MNVQVPRLPLDDEPSIVIVMLFILLFLIGTQWALLLLLKELTGALYIHETCIIIIKHLDISSEYKQQQDEYTT